MSYDDGVTWQPVPVVRLGQHGIAFVKHHARPGFVSLRADSTDLDGNTLAQTIIHAYRIA